MSETFSPSELPAVKEAIPGMRLDMFFFVCITTIIMAWTKIFPPKKYTKYISWDILITIACAFAISKAMENSGFAALVASYKLPDHRYHEHGNQKRNQVQRQSHTDEIRKLITTDTLYDQIRLITDRRTETG